MTLNDLDRRRWEDIVARLTADDPALVRRLSRRRGAAPRRRRIDNDLLVIVLGVAALVVAGCLGVLLLTAA